MDKIHAHHGSHQMRPRKFLNKALNDQKKKIVSDINKLLNDIKSDVQETALIAAGAKNKAERNEAQLGSLQSELELMQASLTSVSEELGDQINRSLRTTKIINGANEEPNENLEDTENILVKILARHLGMHDEAQVAEVIERTHSGKK